MNYVQNAIMLIMGIAAGAVCFTHVHDVTVAYGQPSWVGWVNAITIELMAIALGLELRRRKKTGDKTAFVMAAMTIFIGLSLWAQVATAAPSVGGWIVAVVPAVGFLVLVKVAITRQAEPAEKSDKDSGATVEPVAEPQYPGTAPAAPINSTVEVIEPASTSTPTPALFADLQVPTHSRVNGSKEAA